jgi:hypothetical protein
MFPPVENPHLFNSVKDGVFIPGALGTHPVIHKPTEDDLRRQRQADEAAHQAFVTNALSHMTQRDHVPPPDDYDDVPVDYEVSDAESVDPYESYNPALQPAPATSIPSVTTSSSTMSHSSTDGPATKKFRYLDEIMKVQTADFLKLAERVGKAPAKYATPEEEVHATGLFRGKTSQQYASDYINFTVPLVFNKKCTVRTGLRKVFLDGFHAYSEDHVRRYGSRLKIEDYIVNYDTLTKMTRGHILR